MMSTSYEQFVNVKVKISNLNVVLPRGDVICELRFQFSGDMSHGHFSVIHNKDK